MADSRPVDGKDLTSATPTATAVEQYVKTLTAEHRVLVILKGQLYGGKWEPMLSDLRNRLAGKPYVFKLAGRIREDIERIERMREFEEKHGIDLVDYVELPI
jgi:hypothetical protein